MKKTHPLRAYRQQHNLSASDVAARLKISPVTVVSYENGNRIIDADRAVDIEKKIGIDRSVLRPDLFKREAA